MKSGRKRLCRLVNRNTDCWFITRRGFLPQDVRKYQSHEIWVSTNHLKLNQVFRENCCCSTNQITKRYDDFNILSHGLLCYGLLLVRRCEALLWHKWSPGGHPWHFMSPLTHTWFNHVTQFTVFIKHLILGWGRNSDGFITNITKINLKAT